MNYRVLAKTTDMTRAEWLEVRRRGLGGSDAAAICGVSPWRGPLSVYLTKIGASPDSETTEQMSWGNVLEEPIAQEFARRTQQKIKRCNMVLQHPTIDWMLANVDRLTFDPEEDEWGVLEVKNVGEYKASDWADGVIPDYYLTQAMHYLAVTGANYIWFAPLIGGNRMNPVKVMRDDRLIASLIKIERDFWHLVETRTPPPLDDSVDASKVLKHIYPTSTQASVTVDESLITRLRAAKNRVVDAEKEVRGLENQLKEQMKEAEAAYIPGNPKPAITWRGSTTKKLDVAALEAAEPELCVKYMREVPMRRFLVK